MSYCVDFIFNVPERFATAVEFAEWLRAELGISLARAKGEERLWVGMYLGLPVEFSEEHGMEPDLGLPYDEFSASIGVTGSAGAGDLRVAMVSAVVNLALALVRLLEMDGVVIWDVQERVVGLGVRGEGKWLWNLDRDARIRSYSDLAEALRAGVCY